MEYLCQQQGSSDKTSQLRWLGLLPTLRATYSSLGSSLSGAPSNSRDIALTWPGRGSERVRRGALTCNGSGGIGRCARARPWHRRRHHAPHALSLTHSALTPPQALP